MNANNLVTTVKGVGPAVAEKLQKLRIKTVEELIEHVPFRFDDYANIIRVSQIRPGLVTIQVTIGSIRARYSGKGLHMTEATASDESGSVKLVWFNQPYRAQSIKQGEEYFVSGEFASNYKYFAITNPACELVSSFPVNTARLVPVYRLTKGLGATQLRRIVKNALQDYRPGETLPAWLIKQEKLIPHADALKEMHFPDNYESLARAKERLGFEEVFQLTLASELNKQQHKKEHSLQIDFSKELISQFVASLPFKLTESQRRVSWQVLLDLQEGAPMNRLVEGDVGSGKTVVAVMAALNAAAQGYQVAFMAPTELLAKQHAENISKMLNLVNYSQFVGLLVGSMNKKQKNTAYQAISNGKSKVVVGTHALFQESVSFNRLGLIIVDEQHRFGVEQRKKLQSKADEMPHVLSMTATPIPRSLALTLYGEMDVSVLNELPPGRKPVNTEIIQPENREKLYTSLKSKLSTGGQAFVVCPQIEEDDASRLSVKKIHHQLAKKWLKEFRVELLHGKLEQAEKDAVMQQYVEGRIDVLVATTVIEVGVDVPNASVMIIEGADKFGLAQLHQLRGRVGRGSDNAYCYLVTSENGQPSKRLQLLEHEHNGFTLAEYDLELRGPGAIYGTMQHGALDLRVAKLTDTELIQRARAAAKQFIVHDEKLVKYKQLHQRVQELRKVTNLN